MTPPDMTAVERAKEASQRLRNEVLGSSATDDLDRLLQESANAIDALIAALPQPASAGAERSAKVAFERADVLDRAATSMDAQERRDRRDDEDLSRMADDMRRRAELAREIGNAVLALPREPGEAWRGIEGWKLVPEKPTEAMLEAALEESGNRVTAYTAPRESGVATECDLSEDDAAKINRDLKAAYGDQYEAMLAVAPSSPLSEQKRGEPEGHERD